MIKVCVHKCASLCSIQAYFDRGVCTQVCVVALYTNILWSKLVFTRVCLGVLYKYILIEVCFHKSLYSMQSYFHSVMCSQVYVFSVLYKHIFHRSICSQVFTCTFYTNIFLSKYVFTSVYVLYNKYALHRSKCSQVFTV